MIVARSIDPARILQAVGLPLFALLAYDITITLLYVHFHQRWVAVDNLPLALLGSALAIIIGLRNNSAYGRWWEARTLWGSAVNNSRSLARGALMFLPDATAATLVRLQIAWAHALRGALLKQDPWRDIDAFVPADIATRIRSASNLPTALNGEMGRLLAVTPDVDCAVSVRMAALDATLTAIANAQGGLERIKNTPLPRQFEQFPRVFVLAYCLLLPIGLVTDLGIMTPIGSTVIGSAFVLLDQIGRDIEDPFANSIHDVAMAAITRTIEIDLRQMLGETNTPPPLQPTNGILP
jgi:putative membrane protein